MAALYPKLENIRRLRVSPEPGELTLISYLKENLDDTYEVFFNPYLDGDRPDIIILKEHCCAFIIEVKDWHLKNYRITTDNKWEVYDGRGYSRKVSPQSQTFRYKKNLYDLHLPIVGLARLTNPNFYNLVHCFVYFHNADRRNLNDLYHSPESNQSKKMSVLNKELRENKITFEVYDKATQYLERVKRNTRRDRSLSFGSDQLDQLVKKIRKNSKHVLFDERVYMDFKRRLGPSEQTLKQGIPINYDKKQLPITESKEKKEKVKGVAGCGKTSILCKRAINAHERHGSTILVLTFNITLKNCIRDKISDMQGTRDFSGFEISNYHQFFNSQVNNTGKDITILVEKYGMDKLYSTDVFENDSLMKYQTILIDEIQDYKSEWVKIVRDNFLSETGEMVLFGDESQNIYQRKVARSAVIAQGFGRWIKLRRSYRTALDSPLNLLFKDFQTQFLIEKHTDTEVFEVSPAQMRIGFSILKYEQVQLKGWQDSIFGLVNSYISGYALHPNDIVILSSRISLLRQLNELWLGDEKTHCMFETYEELASIANIEVEELRNRSEDQIYSIVKNNKEMIERTRRAKKNHFYANSGLVKLSTIHSYKGLGSKTVFYLLNEDDDAEVVYTSITRSSENLIIFDLGGNNTHSEFFKNSIK